MRKPIKLRIMRSAETVDVVFARYASDELAIFMREPITHEPFAKVTVSCEPYGLEPIDHNNQIYLKDYGENEGMFQAMIDAGLIEKTALACPMGHTFVYKCNLTTEAIEEARRQGVMK